MTIGEYVMAQESNVVIHMEKIADISYKALRILLIATKGGH